MYLPDNDKSFDPPLVIGGKTITSRFFLGTGKFRCKKDLKESIVASGTEVVTVALRRIDVERHEENILEYIPDNITLMVNTSGARNASEAVEIARIFREGCGGNWVKIEVIDDSRYLLPDNYETVKATAALVAEGFVVLPYMYPDLYITRELEKAGAAAIMPLGAVIGSCRGLKTRDFLEIMVAETQLPIIVDAGIGRPSHATEAMEIGVSAVLANTAVAAAEKPAEMARAFALAVKAGRGAYLAGLSDEKSKASASSPITGFLFDKTP